MSTWHYGIQHLREEDSSSFCCTCSDVHPISLNASYTVYVADITDVEISDNTFFVSSAICMSLNIKRNIMILDSCQLQQLSAFSCVQTSLEDLRSQNMMMSFSRICDDDWAGLYLIFLNPTVSILSCHRG